MHPTSSENGQISCDRYIAKLVNSPRSLLLHTSQPPTPSVNAVAAVSVKPTGRLSGLHFNAPSWPARGRELCEVEGACVSGRARAACAPAIVAARIVQVREGASESARSVQSARMNQNESPSGKGSSAIMPAPTDPSASSRDQNQVRVRRTPPRSFTGRHLDRLNVVCRRAIKSPVRLRLKNGGPCSVSRSYRRVRSSTPS